MPGVPLVMLLLPPEPDPGLLMPSPPTAKAGETASQAAIAATINRLNMALRCPGWEESIWKAVESIPLIRARANMRGNDRFQQEGRRIEVEAIRAQSVRRRTGGGSTAGNKYGEVGLRRRRAGR